MQVTIERISRKWRDGNKGRYESIGIFTTEHQSWINGFGCKATETWNKGDKVNVVIKERKTEKGVKLDFEPVYESGQGAQNHSYTPPPREEPTPQITPAEERSPKNDTTPPPNARTSEGVEILRDNGRKLDRIIELLSNIGTDVSSVKIDLKKFPAIEIDNALSKKP